MVAFQATRAPRYLFCLDYANAAFTVSGNPIGEAGATETKEFDKGFQALSGFNLLSSSNVDLVSCNMAEFATICFHNEDAIASAYDNAEYLCIE